MAFKFRNILNSSTTITYEKVVEAFNARPKRICLKTCHSNSLRTTNFENSDVKWALFIPFEESFRRIFEKETGLDIYRTSSGRYWCPMKTEEEYDIAKEFKAKFEKVVFLRDTLDTSIALSEHIDENEERTEIGELEYQAKYQGDEEAFNSIVEKVVFFIENTPLYKSADCICAVPSSNPDEPNLPMRISEAVAERVGITDISNTVNWVNDKVALKETSIEDKWQALDETDISIESDCKGKNVILIDDLYQSGTTMQFVGMKLKEAGIKKVHGLAIVKSRRDTDNT